MGLASSQGLIYPGNWKALCSRGRIGGGMQLGCSFHQLFLLRVPICHRRACPCCPCGPLKHLQLVKCTKPVWSEKKKKKNSDSLFMNSFHTVLRCIKRIATDTVNGFHRTRTLGSCAKMKVFEIFLFLLHLVAEKHSPGFFGEEFSRRMRQIVAS